MEMQRQDLEEDRGLPWPLCSMMAQAEFNSGMAVVLRSVMRMLSRREKCLMPWVPAAR